LAVLSHCGQILYLRTKFCANRTNRCEVTALNSTFQYGARPPYWILKFCVLVI